MSQERGLPTKKMQQWKNSCWCPFQTARLTKTKNKKQKEEERGGELNTKFLVD